MAKKKQILSATGSASLGNGTNFNNLSNSTYTIPTQNGKFLYKGLPLYKSLNDSDALMNASQYKDKSFDPIAYLSNQIILNENNKPSVSFNKNSKQNWYNPLTNNLNIHDSKGVLAELSHSAQAKQKSVIAGIAGDWLQHPYVTPKGQKSHYHIPGTTEYDAHSVIEPQLKQRYLNVYDSLNDLKKKGMPLFEAGGNNPAYQAWRSKLPKNLQYENDYDLFGFWKENPTWSPSDPNAHMTDKFKLPNHETFSNESMYYNGVTPGVGGYWNGDNFQKNPAVGPPMPPSNYFNESSLKSKAMSTEQPSYQDLKSLYSDNEIMNLLNTVAKNNQTGSILMAQNGLDLNFYPNDDWEVIDDSELQFRNGGKNDFYNSLVQSSKPITDKGNFSKIPYTQSQSNTLQNVKKKQYEIAKTQLDDEKRARAVKDKNAPYVFPDGKSKTWEQMSDHEKGFINAEILRNKGRWNENSVEQPLLNTFNPITMLYDMAAGIGESGYQSEQQNSILPYITGIGVPLLTGALSGIGAKTTGQFVNNLVNPLAGIKNPIKKSNIRNSQSAIQFESFPHARNLEQLSKLFPNAAIEKKVISPTAAWNIEANDKIKNETLDILEHWAYKDPSQLRQYESILSQIKKLNKKRDHITGNSITLSNKRNIESIDHKLEVIDKHLKGLPTGEDEDYINHLMKKNEDPNFRLGLEREKQERLNDLNVFGDEYLWPYRRKESENWTSQQAWDFSNNLQAKKDALDLQINTLQGQQIQPEIHPQFEKKIQDLYSTAGEAQVPITDPFIDNSFRNRTKIVYPQMEESMNQLSLYDKRYIEDNVENLLGVRTADNTITLGSAPSHKTFDLGYSMIEKKVPFDITKPATWWGGQKRMVKSDIPSTIIENSHYYNVSNNNLSSTIAHETGHDFQKFGDWDKLIDKYDPMSLYYTTHGDNAASKIFQEALIEPTVPVNGRFTNDTWRSSGKELHSDLMAERVSIIKDLHSDPKKAVDMFRQNEDQMNEMIINKGGLDKFFKPETSNETKKKLIRMLPAVIPAIGAGMALQEKQNGGLNDEWEVIE